MSRRLGAWAAIGLLALIFASPGTAGTYFVSTSGSDGNPGTVAAPWRTIARVNNARLAPGDKVLFRAGESFGDSTLMPAAAGTPTAPIVFGSYGSGRARIANGNGAVWLPGGDHDLVFSGLDLSSSSAGVFASAASGSGVTRITLKRSVVHDSPALGLLNQAQDSNWTIRGNTFRHLGDSGLIVQGARTRIVANRITDTGWNTSLGYGKHGIYAKAPDLTIARNSFSRNLNGQAISLRFHGARVVRNVIHDTPYAIAVFPQDPANRGASVVSGNRMWNISGYAFYYNGTNETGAPAGLDFVWSSNVVELQNSPEAVNVSEVTAARVSIVHSVFKGSYGSAYRGCPICSEHHNVWSGASSNVPHGPGDRVTLAR